MIPTGYPRLNPSGNAGAVPGTFSIQLTVLQHADVPKVYSPTRHADETLGDAA